MAEPLNVLYRTFDGFERALATQVAHFQGLHPGVTVHLEHCGPEELYERMIGQDGAHAGQYDVMLSLTDWLPELMKRGGLVRLNRYLAADQPEDWPDGWSESMKALQNDASGNVFGMAYHDGPETVSYTHLRAHETRHDLVCR